VLARRLSVRSLASRLPARVWLVLAIALALRVTVVALTVNTPTTLDPADFSRTALSIAQGHGYPPSNRAPWGGPSAFRPPGYPFFLAAVYAIAGGEVPPAGRFVGAFLGTLSVGLIGLIALRLWGKRVSMIALGIAAVAPPLVILSTALISESLFVPVVLGAVATAVEARRSRHRYRWAIATGVLVGIGALTRTNGLILLLAFALALAPTRARWRLHRWAPAAAMFLAAVVTIAPWTVRNWMVFHAFIPISDESGYTIAGTYDQISRADRTLPAVWVEAEHGASPEYAQILFDASIARWNELAFGNRLQAQALAFANPLHAQALDEIKADPAYVLKVGYWNALRMFHLTELDLAVLNLSNTDIPRIPALFEIYGFYPLGVLALAGLLTRRARRAPKWLWLVPLCLATSVFVTGFIRFRSALDPFLVMLAALAIAAAFERRARRRHRDEQPVRPFPVRSARTASDVPALTGQQ
jgi:4-amino-4-deoxy-L-arabinose transferase-like glycosyltransferase